MRARRSSNRRLLVLDDWRLGAGEPERRVLGVIAEGLDLARERPHVRSKADGKIVRGVELARLGVGLRLVEDAEERRQRAFERRHAGLIKRNRHGAELSCENHRDGERGPCLPHICDDINLGRTLAGSRRGATTACVSLLVTTGTISNVTPQPRHWKIHCWISRRSSQRMS